VFKVVEKLRANVAIYKVITSAVVPTRVVVGHALVDLVLAVASIEAVYALANVGLVRRDRNAQGFIFTFVISAEVNILKLTEFTNHQISNQTQVMTHKFHN
jgi:hypothetical protein